MDRRDRIINNLNVLQKQGIIIDQEIDFYNNLTTYRFEINDDQLAQLNISELNDIFIDEGIKPGKLFIRKSSSYINEMLREIRKNANQSDDYKNKPYLRSNYMNSLDIVKVEVLNDRVVIMRFGDGSFTKAVCTEDDAKNGKFDVDIGITICLMKKMLGETESNKKGYAKLLRNIHKMMESQEKEVREAEQLKMNAKARKMRKAQRRAAAVKQANDELRNDISDAVLYALERLEERKAEPEKVD